MGEINLDYLGGHPVITVIPERWKKTQRSKSERGLRMLSRGPRAKECGQPPEGRQRHLDSDPVQPIWTSHLCNGKMIHLCYSKPPSLWGSVTAAVEN